MPNPPQFPFFASSLRLNSLRLFLLTAIALLLITPWLAWSAVNAMQAMRNKPIFWIPAENVQRQQYEWFRTSFRIHDAVVVSWPGCTVDDVRLNQFAEAIQTPSESEQERESEQKSELEQSFDSVSTGYGALRQMMREPLELSRRQALARLSGVLVGDDGRTSCAVLSLSEYGVEHPDASLELVSDVLRQRLEIDPEEAYLAGPVVEGTAIDRLSARAMQLYLLPSGLLVLLLARLCLRRWRLTLVLVAVASFGELLVLALVWITGATMNAVLIVMAPLVFVLTVSAGVHLLNYYRDEVRQQGTQGAVSRALRAGWVPCSLAALTTAIGLVSLVLSDMTPIRQFGAISAVGVVTTTGLLFLLLPESMRRWGDQETGPELPEAEPAEKPFSRLGWARLAGWIDRGAVWIGLASLALIVLMAVGLSRVRTSVNILSLLGPSSPTAHDYRWLETHLAPIIPIEVIIRTDPDDSVDWLDQIRLLRDVQQEIETLETLGGTMSAASFVPLIPEGGGLRSTVQRAVVRETIESQLDQFEENRYLFRSEQYRALRVTTRAPATMEVDYGHLLVELRQRVQPVLDRYHQQHDVEIDALYTGMTPLIHVAQQTLLDDLIRSFLAALVFVAMVVILVLRSVSAGLVAMLPNVLPAVVLFGAMGWLEIPVDIGSMMTASVALGIAIDGTLHFLIWFRRETSQGVSPRDAVARTYRHCGTAMWQTAVICGLGLLVFGFSQFVPTRRFAWMVFLLLLLALVGDLVVLPALLMGPLRRIFIRKPATK